MNVTPTIIDLLNSGHRVVASVSGGKDSTALSLHLKERGIDHLRVFADTGWEHPLTYEHLDYLRTVLGPIDVVRSKKYGGMVGLVQKKGMLPHRVFRMCTQELKVKPLNEYIKQHSPAISAVGIRAGESTARSKLSEREFSPDLNTWIWRPLIAWSEQAVIDIHRRHGVRPNPLYLKGATRVGCWPCIFSRKAEIALVATLTPERIDEIRELEKSTEVAARTRYAARGETFESLGYVPPTFFSKDSGFSSIDRVVRWATNNHTEQQEMFAPSEQEIGCMRWGFCEHNTDKDETK